MDGWGQALAVRDAVNGEDDAALAAACTRGVACLTNSCVNDRSARDANCSFEWFDTGEAWLVTCVDIEADEELLACYSW